MSLLQETVMFENHQDCDGVVWTGPVFRLFICLILSLYVCVAESQGVFKVKFADLAIVDTRFERLPARIEKSNAEHRTFRTTLEIAIDNLGDLPATSAHAQVRIYLPGHGINQPHIQISVRDWDQYGVIHLAGQPPPDPPHLRSMQSGVFVAHELDLAGVSDVGALLVCIEFPDDAPFGDREDNNCVFTTNAN